MKNLVVLVLTLFIVSGCATRSVVAEAEGYNEMFVGTVFTSGFGTGSISVTAKKSKVSCDGDSYITHHPQSLGCAGQIGRFSVSCTDGRKVKGSFEVESCKVGSGEGSDQEGRKFTFAFGMSESDADQRVRERIGHIANKPNLPTYNPREVRKEKGFATGTGFYVTNDGYMVTNYHVIEGASTVMVVNPSKGKEWLAKVVQVDSANDVALIKVDDKTIPIPLAQSFSSQKGDEVLTLGYPMVAIQGQEQKATFGRVNSTTGIQNDVRLVQIDVPIQPGNSGGPLLNDKGEVIGVVTMTLNQIATLRASGSLPQNVNYAVKVDYVHPALNAAHVGKESMSKQSQNKLSMRQVVAIREASVMLVISK